MSSTKGWTPEEDALIVSLVNQHGIKKWSVVAAELPGRNGKQCRERWHNQLDPNIKRGQWTFEEDQILLNAHREYGSKWSVIAKFLPGRTDNSIKNRWNSALRRELRKMNRAAEDAEMEQMKAGSEATPESVARAAVSAVAIPSLATVAASGLGIAASAGGALGVPALTGAGAGAGADSEAADAAAGEGAPAAARPFELSGDEASGLRSALLAIGNPTDDSEESIQKRALREQLITQLRALNQAWEETGSTPSANHIQELGKQVSRLQDFCRDLVGSSLTRQQLEIASGVVPKRRQCMARGRRRMQRELRAQGRHGSEGGRAPPKRARRASGGSVSDADARPSADEDDDGDSALDAADPTDSSSVAPSPPAAAAATQHARSAAEVAPAHKAGTSAGAAALPPVLGSKSRRSQPGGRAAAKRTASAAAAAADAGELPPTLPGDPDLSARLLGFGSTPVLTPGGTSLAFDVEEILQLTSASLADVLASPRGAPLVTLSPAHGLSFILPTPRDGAGAASSLPAAPPAATSALAMRTAQHGTGVPSGLMGAPASGSGLPTSAIGELPSPRTAAAAFGGSDGTPSRLLQLPRRSPRGHTLAAWPGSASASEQQQPRTPSFSPEVVSSLNLVVPSPLPRRERGVGAGGAATMLPPRSLAPTAGSSPGASAPALAPSAERRPSGLSSRRRPVGATNLHIAFAAGERPVLPPSSGGTGGPAQPPPRAAADADLATLDPSAVVWPGGGGGSGSAGGSAGSAAVPSPLHGDPLAKAIVNDVSAWLQTPSCPSA